MVTPACQRLRGHLPRTRVDSRATVDGRLVLVLGRDSSSKSPTRNPLFRRTGAQGHRSNSWVRVGFQVTKERMNVTRRAGMMPG